MLYPGATFDPVEMTDQAGRTLSVPRECDEQRTAIFFLRYLGCPLCKSAMARLASEAGRFHAKGVKLLAVVQSAPQDVARYADQHRLPYALVADPKQRLYRRFEVERGGLGSMLAPSVLGSALKATLQGHLHGRFDGDERQLPAAFLLDRDGTVRHVRYGRTVADMPTPDELLTVLR